MDKPKFTPGPWVTSDRTDHDEIYAAAYPGRPICHSTSYWQGPGPRAEERLANAHLIAAAPRLYDVLSRVRDGIAYNEIDAALAEARGEQ